MSQRTTPDNAWHALCSLLKHIVAALCTAVCDEHRAAHPPPRPRLRPASGEGKGKAAAMLALWCPLSWHAVSCSTTTNKHAHPMLPWLSTQLTLDCVRNPRAELACEMAGMERGSGLLYVSASDNIAPACQ